MLLRMESVCSDRASGRKGRKEPKGLPLWVDLGIHCTCTNWCTGYGPFVLGPGREEALGHIFLHGKVFFEDRQTRDNSSSDETERYARPQDSPHCISAWPNERRKARGQWDVGG